MAAQIVVRSLDPLADFDANSPLRELHASVVKLGLRDGDDRPGMASESLRTRGNRRRWTLAGYFGLTTPDLAQLTRLRKESHGLRRAIATSLPQLTSVIIGAFFYTHF